MEPETIQAVRALLEIGSPAVFLVFIIVLYRDLRTFITTLTAVDTRLDEIERLIRIMITKISPPSG